MFSLGTGCSNKAIAVAVESCPIILGAVACKRLAKVKVQANRRSLVPGKPCVQ
jgi:hypothetical protein